jgi:4-hydroxyacetophenone monooxygenase
MSPQLEQCGHGHTAVASTPQHAGVVDIDDAVNAADPMVLRGLLYYLTADEEVAATKVTNADTFQAFSGFNVADPADVKLLRRKAAAFLGRYRAEGDAAILAGAAERVSVSMNLTAGEEIRTEEIEHWAEELAIDPWARALKWTRPAAADRLDSFSVVVIGAGMAGLNAAIHLKKAGISYTVIERNAGVGGTWWENRYPGARVDTPSRTYMHIHSLEFNWPGPYSAQVENQRYFDWMADNFNVRRDIVFNTEVKSLIWDDVTATWEITTQSSAGTSLLRANAVISAVGLFGRPSIPPIEGLDRFRGRAFHSSRWPEGLITERKHFAVIGTGATGYQMIPELANAARHVTVFQRTPQWVLAVEGYLSPFPPQIAWLDRNFPFHKNFVRLRVTWLTGPRERARMMDIDPDFRDPHSRSAVNKMMRDRCIAFMEGKFRDRPELVRKMLPDHPVMSARPVIADAEYSIYDALLRDNVTLVTEGVARITEDGIVTRDGLEHKVDAIVFATGFKANDFLSPMEIRGRGARRIDQLWAKDGPRAYLGTMLPGIPNFFMLYGPNTNPHGGVSIVNHEDLTTRYILECLGHLIIEGKRSIEPKTEAYSRYNEELDCMERKKIYTDERANNYYRTQFGSAATRRSAVNCPISGQRVWTLLRRPNLDELIVE